MLASTVIMVVFGYFLFRRRILVPMEALVGGTKELTAGRFDTRLPPGPANELGELARVFNDMARALESYRTTNEQQLDELRHTNADLSQAREDLIFAEKMATVGRLAAGVAHEVGNPLASVIGFVEILEHDEEGAMGPDLLPRIRAELDRIHRIIGDLLSYARPSEGGGVAEDGLENTPVSIADVVATAAALVTAQPRFSAVRFDVQLSDDLPQVLVDAGRLQQILLNLFVNSGEALMGDGCITVTRLDGPEQNGDLVTIAVEDDGPGVDPRARSNLFEPFFTTKEVGAGTGLGLAVSSRIVDQMGGSLSLQREHPGGACFHLSLPVAEPSS
jgi:signal transduction histidine kinase